MAIKKTKRTTAPLVVPRAEQRAELFARLSAGARDDIKYHIDWYRGGASWRGQGRRIELPSEFDQVRKAAVSLSELVNRVGVDRIASIFFQTELIDVPGMLPDDQAIQVRLEQMLGDLKDFDNRLTAAQRHGKHRGRKTDRARHFVQMVASVIERDKGQPIKRSKNKGSLAELLREIVYSVDSDIGPGTVEEVLRERSSRRRGEITS